MVSCAAYLFRILVWSPLSLCQVQRSSEISDEFNNFQVVMVSGVQQRAESIDHAVVRRKLQYHEQYTFGWLW